MDISSIMTQYIVERDYLIEKIKVKPDYKVIIEIGYDMKIQLSRFEAKKILKKIKTLDVFKI